MSEFKPCSICRSNFQLMKALAVHTRVSPASRIEKLRDFNHRLQRNDLVLTVSYYAVIFHAALLF